MPCCDEGFEVVLGMVPVCMYVRGELVLGGDLGGRLAAAADETIIDLTVSDRTCTLGVQYMQTFA